MAEVGEKPDVAARGAEQVTHGVGGVVRDAEGLHGHIAEFKTRAGLEESPIEFCRAVASGFEAGEERFVFARAEEKIRDSDYKSMSEL